MKLHTPAAAVRVTSNRPLHHFAGKLWKQRNEAHLSDVRVSDLVPQLIAIEHVRRRACWVMSGSSRQPRPTGKYEGLVRARGM